MSKNPLAAKVAEPYARALFDFSIEKNLMLHITSDFQNLDVLLSQSSDLSDYLNNPIISNEEKKELIDQTLKTKVSDQTLKFLNILVRRNRINLLQSVIANYLDLVYELASIKKIEVSTAFAFTNLQKNNLIKKLKELTNAREISLVINVNSSLIGGFFIKTNSDVIDYTVKNQLQLLAKHLDSVLEI